MKLFSKKATAQKRLNKVSKGVDKSMGMFTDFVKKLKKHNDELSQIKEHSESRIAHYSDLSAKADTKINQNASIISKVENLLN